MTPLERIIRPIVEGQIRGFLKEHPAIVDAVDWYNVPGRDKAASFIGSLSKRIVRDLTCGSSSARLAAVLLAWNPEAPSSSAVELRAAPTPARLAPDLSEPEPPRQRRQRILRAPSSTAPTPALNTPYPASGLSHIHPDRRGSHPG